MGSLTKRILVALVAIPILLFATFWEHSFLFKVLAVAGIGLAFFEYLNLADARKLKTLRIEGLLSLGFVLLTWVLRPAVHWEGWGMLLVGVWILTLSFLWSNRPVKEMITSVSVTFFGVAYFGLLGVYFFRLRELQDGPWHLTLLFIATWAYDTGGFFAGKFWGRHKLAPLTSPKKTWEGCAGGFVLTLAGLLLLRQFLPFYSRTYGGWDILALSVLLSFFGQVGDLVESVIKRSLSAKDSGSFFPGHGGVFDRIDSLLFNAPVLFYYLTLLKK
jgi:phosphatidate cytidylyltransferase